MVLVNNVELDVNQLDTVIILKDKIAVMMDTLPRYLYFPDFSENIVPLPLPDDIKVEDVLSSIKENAKKNTNFEKFFTPNSEKFAVLGLNIYEDVIIPWLVYNPAIERMVSLNFMFLDNVYNQMEQFVSTRRKFDNIWKDRQNLKNKLEADINRVKKTVTSQKKMYGEFDTVKGRASTMFHLEKITVNVTIDLENVSLLELLNGLTLSVDIPFCSVNNYYKILTEFTPPDEWIVSSDDIMILMVKHKTKEYVLTKIFFEDEKLTLEVTLEESEVEEFIRFVLQSFSYKPTFSNRREKEIAGAFYFPNTFINTYIFSDLSLNDALFSSLIAVDESIKTSKGESLPGIPKLYIHFIHPYIGHIKAGMVQRVAKKGDPIYRLDTEGKLKYKQIFKIGSYYLRIRAKGIDRKSVDSFRDILSKLLVFYGKKDKEITDYYTKFIPDFGEIEEDDVPEDELSKYNVIAPEVFVKGYTRRCNADRLPTAISEDEAKKETRQVIKYPRDVPESGDTYPSDGVNQKYYICENPEFPYPGIRQNNLRNSDKYPFIPCCYKLDQTKKHSYKRYYGGEEKKAGGSKQQALLQTDKIAKQDVQGILSDELLTFLKQLDPTPSYTYIRLGVFRNKSCFLTAVMTGLEHITKIMNTRNRTPLVYETRKKLASISPVALQCNYEKTLSEIKDIITDQNEYLNPRRFIQLLEQYFKCNIVVFNPDSIVVPHYSQGFLSYKNDFPYVLIYEHTGSEADSAKYPQCELIIRWNTEATVDEEDTEYYFNYNDRLIKRLRKSYVEIVQTYALNTRVQYTIFPLPLPRTNIVSQSVDSYGKCRRINLIFKGKEYSVGTTPMPPLNVPLSQEMRRVNESDASDFLREVFGVSPQSQTLIEGKIASLNSYTGNVSISVFTELNEPVLDLPVDDDMYYPLEEKSYLDEYNKNKKLARYLTEYLFWMFSRFLSESGIGIGIGIELETESDDIIERFVKEKIVIKNIEYGNVGKFFSLDSGFIKSGKLIIKDNETLKRLIYVLRLNIKQNLKKIISYDRRKVIERYYEDITDFDYSPSQIILSGEDEVLMWLKEKTHRYRLEDSVKLGDRLPYFFRNKLISNRVFLAQNIDSIEKASYVCWNWNSNGFNPSIHAKKAPIYPFTLYKYSNKDNIEMEKIGKEKSDFKIIGYKNDDKSHYTSLLRV